MRRRFALLGLLALLVPGPAPAAPAGAATPFRVAFLSTMFVDQNENDAKAALNAWSKGVLQERQLNLQVEVDVCRNLKELGDALRTGKVDGMVLTAVEYRRIQGMVGPCTFFGAEVGGSIEENCVLLVRADNPAKRLSDLRGRRMIVSSGPRASLADAWLESLSRDAGLGPFAGLSMQVTRAQKSSQVVLPVFFRQADACVITRQAFEVMTELNPQLGGALRVFALSPSYVPNLLCIRDSVDPAVRRRIIASLGDLHHTAAGRQVLNVFQYNRLVEIQPSVLDATLQLVARGTPAPPGNGPGVPAATAASAARSTERVR